MELFTLIIGVILLSQVGTMLTLTIFWKFVQKVIEAYVDKSFKAANIKFIRRIATEFEKHHIRIKDLENDKGKRAS